MATLVTVSESNYAAPLVSVVTPSYNMARFLEETIESVLAQDYPNIEYLVVDGGSSDGTVDLLRRYEGRLRWISEKDGGQSDAVNKGFRMTRGEIFAFLNADDLYLPGAISAAVRGFEENPDAAVVYGEGYYAAEDGSIIRRYPTEPFDRDRLGLFCYISQPSAFMRRSVLEEVGLLDVNKHYALDYELWMRIAQRHPMAKVDHYMAKARMYRDTKTFRLRAFGLSEVMSSLQHYYGYIPPHWVYGYIAARYSGTDGFFEPDVPTWSKCFATVAVGSAYNWRKPFRYWGDCGRLFWPGVKAVLRGRFTEPQA
jgi:glycosyltransferase involved in cell wall biosynthesis